MKEEGEALKSDSCGVHEIIDLRKTILNDAIIGPDSCDGFTNTSKARY